MAEGVTIITGILVKSSESPRKSLLSTKTEAFGKVHKGGRSWHRDERGEAAVSEVGWPSVSKDQTWQGSKESGGS